MISWIFGMFVILLVVLIWLVRRRAEAFEDKASPVEPKEILQKVRGILSRYNDPALWEHLDSIIGKDVGELARQTAAKQ
jgi:hypothetical protein